MERKIKISLIDESKEEVDYIARYLPNYNSYDFSKAVLADLFLLFERNGLDDFLLENLRENIKR